MSFMGWDYDKVVELIDAYKNKPELWDPRNNNYQLRHKKQDAWIDISLQFETDVEIIRGKMGSLLSSFRREKSRMKKRTGHAQSHWFAYNNFKFLLDKDEVIGTKKTKTEAGRESDQECAEDVPHPDALFTYDPHPPDEALEQVSYNNSTSTNNRLPQKRHRYEMSEKDGEYVFIRKHSKDECSVFGKHVAMKLRQFSDTSRKILMHRINNAIFEEETKEFNINRQIIHNISDVNVD